MRAEEFVNEAQRWPDIESAKRAFVANPRLQHLPISTRSAMGASAYQRQLPKSSNLASKLKHPPVKHWHEVDEDRYVETVDIDAVHSTLLREHLASNPALYETREDFQSVRGFLNSHTTPKSRVGQDYVYASVQFTPIAQYINTAHFNKQHRLVKLDDQFAYFDIDGAVKRFPESGTLSGDSLSQIYFFKSSKELEHFDTLLKLKFSNYKHSTKILDQHRVEENFADGQGPGRAGDSQRHGIPKGASISWLEKNKHAKGRKGDLIRWQLNMRNGRKK